MIITNLSSCEKAYFFGYDFVYSLVLCNVYFLVLLAPFIGRVLISNNFLP